MSWFSDDHKNLYSKALSALYDDVKTASNSLIDTTGNVLILGYNKIKTTADYLDKKYSEINDDEETDNTEETSDIDNTEETDEYISNMNRAYSDILIKLNKNHSNINKIWIIDGNGDKTQVKGKIESYPCVSIIIHQWFEYKSRDKRGFKWYPTLDLYTAYRESSRKLEQIHYILFRYSHNQRTYKPQKYHPLV